MKVLTIGQNKGGVGKTTVSRIIAAAAARAGHRVLAIDLDSQCSLSQRFLDMRRDPASPEESFTPPTHPGYDPAEDGDWNGVSNSADIYFTGSVVPYPTAIPNLEIAPGNSAMLKAVEMVRSSEVVEKVHKRMREFLRLPEVQEAYDLVVIDTPPSKGPLSESALQAATHMLIPSVMEPMCIEGLQGMLSMLMHANNGRAKDDRIQLIGILVNKYKKSGLHAGLLESLREDPVTGPLILPTIVWDRIAFAESDHVSMRPDSVLDMRDAAPARREAEAFVKDVLDSLELTHEHA